MGAGIGAPRVTYFPLLISQSEGTADKGRPEEKEATGTLESGCSWTAGSSQGSADPPSTEAERPRPGPSSDVRAELWQWWKDTMAPEFLKSRVSKRSSWRVLFPMLGLAIAVLDVLSMILALTVAPPHENESLMDMHWARSLGLDGLLLLALFSAARLPIRTVQSDAVLAVILGLYPVTYCILLSPENLGLQFYNMLVIFILAHSGIHLCAIMGFWFFTLTALPVMGFRLGAVPITSGFLACFLVAAASIALAPNIDAAFKALQEVKEEGQSDGQAELGAEALAPFVDDASDASAEVPDPVDRAEEIGLPHDLWEEARDLLDQEPASPSGQRLQTAMHKMVHEAMQDRKPLPRGLLTAMRSVQRARRANDTDSLQEKPAEKQAEQALLEDRKQFIFESSEDSATASDVAWMTPVPSQTTGDLSPLPPSGSHDRHGRRMSMRSMGSTEDSKATSSLRYSRSSNNSSQGAVRRMSSFLSNSSPFSAETRRSKPRAEVEHIGVQTDATGYLCKRCMRPPPMPEPRTSSVSMSSVKGAFRSLAKSGRSKLSSRGSASSVSSRGSGTCVDQSSYNPHALFDNASPIVSCYKLTPSLTVQLSLQWSMKHWNLPRIPGSCCPWHTALVVAKTSLDDLSDTGCEPLWSSLTGWQCPDCTSLNHIQVTSCDMCREAKPSNIGTASNSELASTYNRSIEQDASWPTGPALSNASASHTAGSKTLRSSPLMQSPPTASWPAGPASSLGSSHAPPVVSQSIELSSKTSLDSKTSESVAA